VSGGGIDGVTAPAGPNAVAWTALREVEESHYSSDYLDYESREERANPEYFERGYERGSELYGREEQRERERLEQARAHSDISVDSIERGTRALGTGAGAGGPGVTASGTVERAQEAWLDELLARRAKIVQVTYPRTANNDKELTVVRGEYLEILDDSRKWWKARNSRGQVAHVPHTIVTPHNPTISPDNDVFNNPLYAARYQRQSHPYNYEVIIFYHYHSSRVLPPFAVGLCLPLPRSFDLRTKARQSHSIVQ
jgi:epidermal growth factor receptor kinase substrate 8